MSCVALIFVLSCLASLHACNARLLSASIDNQIGRKEAYQVVAEELEKAKELSDETSIWPNMKSASANSMATVEFRTQELEAKNINERMSHHENLGTSSMNLKIPNMPLIEKSDQSARDIGATSGNGITKSFSHIDQLQKSTQTKGQRSQAIRSMLGSVPQDTEEAVDTKESDTLLDDIDMMDYAQPHRKPPIHNEKP